ncbi:MAG: arginase [Halobacteriales archaeon]|jgi:arginase
MTRNVRIIGAPTDYGANRRGVDMGPSAIRYAGLADEIESAGVECVDVGDLSVPRVEEEATVDDEAINAHYLSAIEDVSTRLANEVAASHDDDSLSLVLGGDHSIAIGTLAGSARDADLGVVWFDAHADFNTPETSPSGNVHGMPLAAALGRGVFGDRPWANAPRIPEENVVLVGIRSLDEIERSTLRDSDVTVFTMSDLDEEGTPTVVDRAIEIASDGVDGIHVSLDMDWLDPTEAPGVGTPVRGGVTYREAHAAMEVVAEKDAHGDVLRSLDVVEVNPILDEHNETADLATELAASALGKRIF